MKTWMMAALTTALIVGGSVHAQDEKEHKIAMADVPAPVQNAIKEHSKGATVRGISTEMENGKRVYEAELRINGKTRDVTFDANGGVVSAEEETSIEQIPAAARSAIEKAAVGGKLLLVETVTENGTAFYEGHIKKAGRESEVKVDADGRPVK
jgi:uncharacterized membrane protein YkoI